MISNMQKIIPIFLEISVKFKKFPTIRLYTDLNV